jgi:hypothetical protein
MEGLEVNGQGKDWGKGWNRDWRIWFLLKLLKFRKIVAVQMWLLKFWDWDWDC